MEEALAKLFQKGSITQQEIRPIRSPDTVPTARENCSKVL